MKKPLIIVALAAQMIAGSDAFAFNADDRVQCTGMNVNVRSCPNTGCQVIGHVNYPDLGTVQSGPYSGNGYFWYNVRWDGGLTGYTVQDYLALFTQQPPPTLNSISPNPVTGSNNPITFTLTGSNFVNGARVQVAYSGNGYTFVDTNTNATFVNSTTLTVPITTSTQADTWHVRVRNPDGQLSGQINLVVNAPPSAPILNSISPNPVTGSNNPITFTLTGSNFVNGARVQVAYSGNGYTFVDTNTNATFVNSTTLTVPITTSTQADTWHVRVRNPDGQLSGQINLVVNAPPSAPILNSISPNPVTGSNNPITFTLTGSNFVNGARVQVAYAGNGYTFVDTNTNATFVNSTTLTVPITTSTQADTWHVRVRNLDGQLSGQINLVVNSPGNPAPTLSSINPNPVTGSNSPITFALTGSNFGSGARVQVAYASNGYTFVDTTTSATFVNSTTLTVPIVTTTQADTWHVRVRNPDGQFSGQINLVVNGNPTPTPTPTPSPSPVEPTLGNVSPNPVTGSNTPLTFSLTGTSFASGTKVQVAYASNGYAFVNTNTNATFISSTHLSVPLTTTTQADTWHIRVQNPDGLISNQRDLIVIAPVSSAAPTLNTITPNPVTGSHNPIIFTLTGSNFVSGTHVRVAYAENNYTFANTNTNPTFVNSTQLTVPITTDTTPDTWRVRVQNPDSQLSGEINFVVNAPGANPAPIVGSVSPSPITGSTSPRTFTVSGSDFINGAAVQVAFRDNNYQFQNTHATASFVNSSQLVVPITTGTISDTWRLRVRNPSGQTSNEVNLLIVPPTPTSAPPITSFPNPSSNIYSSVNSFVSNEVSNFSPPAVQSYLTADAQAVDPLHPSGLKNVFSTLSGVLQGIGLGYDLIRANTAGDINRAYFEALLPYLPQNNGTRIADASFHIASFLDFLGDLATPEEALLDIDVWLWTDQIPAQLDEFVANDPTDPDYQAVVVPDSVRPPTLPSTGHAQLDSLFLDSYMKKLSAASFLKAATTTYNRYSTAYSLGDTRSSTLQLQALLNFLHLYDQAMLGAAEDMHQLRTTLSQAGFNDRSADPNAIRTMQQRLALNGVPHNIAQFLSGQGFTTSQIETARQRFLAINPNGTSGTMFDGMTGLSVAAYHGTSDVPGESGNISTRLHLGTGDNVLIGGFIISGPASKKVIVRAIGPSLSQFRIPGVLADPTLELHDASGHVIATNNNWRDTQRAEIEASGLAPSNNFESAIILTLHPGSYTAIVRGRNNTTGVALVEVYDLYSGVGSKLANISTRGLVQTADNVMIGGMIVIGNHAQKVIIRAIGPSLSNHGISNPLLDPTLELHDRTGAVIATNDNWHTTQIGGIITASQVSDIQNSELAPTQPAESAIITTLPPGNYTAIVRGKNNSTGIALVEAYQLDN